MVDSHESFWFDGKDEDNFYFLFIVGKLTVEPKNIIKSFMIYLHNEFKEKMKLYLR